MGQAYDVHFGMRMTAFRRVYGASPLHLLALLASFALAGYAALSWFQGDAKSVLGWFLVVLIGRPLLPVPLYSLLDWVALGGERGRLRAARAPVNAVPYVQVPAILERPAGVVFAPEILTLGYSARTHTSRVGWPPRGLCSRCLHSHSRSRCGARIGGQPRSRRSGACQPYAGPSTTASQKATSARKSS